MNSDCSTRPAFWNRAWWVLRSNSDCERAIEVARPAQHRFFGWLACGFIIVSLLSWGQQVSTVEMNRNDAACYMILAKNLVMHGVYSLDQTAPFRPHTEWPPGVPLVYTLPMTLVGEFPLGTTGTAILHVWSLGIGLLSLWFLWRYLHEVTNSNIALCVTGLTAATKAFLDSSNAPTADAVAVGAAFFALREVELYFRSGRQAPWRVHLTLAMIPLIKPYLGMVFTVYLWKCLTTDNSWRDRVLGLIKLGVCCLPFAAFLGYSVVAAQATGNISAITWLTTDNPTAIQHGVEATDQKTAGEWLTNGFNTFKHFLIYNTVEAVMPVVGWLAMPEWPLAGRLLLLATVGSGIAWGVWGLARSGRSSVPLYGAAMLSFFIVFACDSPRYFTVLTPICSLCFLEGMQGVSAVCRRLKPEWINRGLAATGIIAVALWGQHRVAHAVDPEPFYREIYSVLHQANEQHEISQLIVPYQLQSLAIVEAGQRRVLTSKQVEAGPPSSLRAHSTLILLIKHDPIGRIASQVGAENTGHQQYGVPTHIEFDGQYCRLLRVLPEGSRR